MSGTSTAFATIAAATFGMPVEKVRVVAATRRAPRAPVSGGEPKVTYSVGRAVVLAVEDAREQLLSVAAPSSRPTRTISRSSTAPSSRVGAPSAGGGARELAARRSVRQTDAPVSGYGGRAARRPLPRSPRTSSHVRVDRRDRQRRDRAGPSRRTSAARSTRRSARGRCSAASLQAIGWALYEELVADEEGQLRTARSSSTRCPGRATCRRSRLHRRGARAGRPVRRQGHRRGRRSSPGRAPWRTRSPPRPACACARLPMTPERVWSALRQA